MLPGVFPSPRFAMEFVIVKTNPTRSHVGSTSVRIMYVLKDVLIRRLAINAIARMDII